MSTGSSEKSAHTNQSDTNSSSNAWMNWVKYQEQQHINQHQMGSYPNRFDLLTAHASSSRRALSLRDTCSQLNDNDRLMPGFANRQSHTIEQECNTSLSKLTDQKDSQKLMILPCNEQLDFILPEEHVCFCHKPAHRFYTLEFGPILECHGFKEGALSSDVVCGFHVHELSWGPFCERVRQGCPIYTDFMDLEVCQLYNFTYCAIFRILNRFKIHAPLALPQCFCNRPVSMRLHPGEGLQLACKNSSIDGAKKCSWALKASDVAFPRPKLSLHTYVDYDEYIRNKQEMLKEIQMERAREEQDCILDCPDHNSATYSGPSNEFASMIPED